MSAEEIEQVLEDPGVRARLRAAGIEPAALENDLHSGAGHMVDGRFVVTHVSAPTKLEHGEIPPGLLEGARLLAPDEAVRFFHETGMEQQLREQGMDPAEALRRLQSGEEKIYSKTEVELKIEAPSQAPAPPQPFAPPSDADDPYTTGKL